MTYRCNARARLPMLHAPRPRQPIACSDAHPTAAALRTCTLPRANAISRQGAPSKARGGRMRASRRGAATRQNLTATRSTPTYARTSGTFGRWRRARTSAASGGRLERSCTLGAPPEDEERNRVTKNAASVRSEDNQTGVVSLGCVTLHMKVLLCKTVVVSCGRPARSLVPLPPRTLEMRVRERVS